MAELRPADDAGRVNFGLQHHMNGGSSSNESDWDLGEFLGLDVATADRHDVKFSIARDAGRFECEGFVRAGEGAGVFEVTAEPRLRARNGADRLHDIDDEKQ